MYDQNKPDKIRISLNLKEKEQKQMKLSPLSVQENL